MFRIPFLRIFLASHDNDTFHINRFDVVGWGHKKTSGRARKLAKLLNKPYIAIEDGFLRSIGLGVQGNDPLSLVVDDMGVYYSAKSPSRLEDYILKSEDLEPEQITRAQGLISAFREHQLSKYNLFGVSQFTPQNAPRIVVVDQTKGDASVSGALADDHSFVSMLKSALTNHPNDTIWVKVHPDVVAGKKQGFLYPLPINDERLRVFSDAVNPWDLLNNAEHVYTVSSLMGFEALLANVNVHCFGVPFYAGWGLTNDNVIVPRRNVTRSLQQVFYAAYIQYSRYVDPILGHRCSIEDIINYVIDEKRRASEPRFPVQISHISRWKQTWIGDFLNAWRLEKDSLSNESALLVWGKRSQLEGANNFTIEDGFVRSVGLGVHFNRPISLVCDRTGIYYDSTSPSDLETLLNQKVFTRWDLSRAATIIETLNQNAITKYNVGSVQLPNLPKDKVTILVPGQVEGDASLEFGSLEIQSNQELLEQVRKSNPDAHIIYKPHPDVLAGIRDKGEWSGSFLAFADDIVEDTSMAVLLEHVDEVHTMTSLTGFETLLRGKKVTTYGLPFYAGWGLTTDKMNCPRRTRERNLLELVAATLIYYPEYVDPVTKQTISVEQALLRVKDMKSGKFQVKDYKLRILLALKGARNKVRRFAKPQN